MMQIMLNVAIAADHSVIVSIAAKATIVIGLALFGLRLTRRCRAAVRHSLLLAALSVLLGLPAVAFVAPAITVPLPFEPAQLTDARLSDARVVSLVPNGRLDTADVQASRGTLAPSAERSSWSVMALLIWIWAIGVVVCSAPFAVGLWQVRRLRREALPWPAVWPLARALQRERQLRRPVDIVRHEAVVGPLTYGTRRPVILLPIEALAWRPEDLRRALVHELEHVRRADWASQCLARVVSALYWFHPLVWAACRALDLEAERACDDAVLEESDAIGYAGQLVALAERRTTGTRSPLLAMANRSDLPLRVRAVLDLQQRRGRVGMCARTAAIVMTAGLLVTVAPLHIVAVGEARSAVRMNVPADSARAARGAPAVSAQDAGGAPAPAARSQSLTPGDSLAFDLAGNWQGTIQFPPNEQTRRILVTITKTDAGAMKGLLYIIDRAPGSPVSAISVQGTTVRFTVPGLNETYQGTLGANGSSISGSLTQGASPILPVGIHALNLARATADAAWEIPAAPAPMATDAPLAFDVASIKPSAPGLFTKFLGLRGRTFYTINLSVNDLISFAYGIDGRQIVNAPSWAESEMYDISAAPESAGQPTRPQALVMLQKLLADRFKLTLHHEKRELPVYALTVARSGPKLTQNDSSPNGQSALRFQGLGTLPGSNATMAEFAEVIQSAVDRPIIDRTGLTGRWDFLLKWTPDESEFQRRGLTIPPPTDDPNAPPALFTALQEQLGLRLESTRAQVDVIVIDTVDHPTPN